MMNVGALALTRFQIAYMSRPYLKAKEDFLHKLFDSIAEVGFRQMGKVGEAFEDQLLSTVIKAFGSKFQERQELCMQALDAIEILERVDEEPEEEKPADNFIIHFNTHEIAQGTQKTSVAVLPPSPVCVDNGLPSYDHNCVLDTCAKCGKIARFKKITLVQNGKLIPKLAVECECCKTVLKSFDNKTEAMLEWNGKQREVRTKNGKG